MAGLIHSKQLKKQRDDYVNEVGDGLAAILKATASSTSFTHIYKSTLALDSVLSFMVDDTKPSLLVVRESVRSCNFLVALHQPVLACIELRRVIEATFDCIYFADHPVEWRSLEDVGRVQIESDSKQPIAYNACREPSFYANYAKELFATEISGLAKPASEFLSVKYSELSKDVHAKIHSSPSMSSMLDEMSAKKFASLSKLISGVYSRILIVLAAKNVDKYNALPPVERELSAWLIGEENQNIISEKGIGF